MFKSLIVAAALVVSTAAQAADSIATVLFQAQQKQIQESVQTFGLDWKVGDVTNYKMNIGGFINGTMKMYVREVLTDSIWFNQEADLMGQKQVVEILINSSTGEILKMIVNGKEEKVPEAGNQEVIEQKQVKLTVPAGSFDAIYLKIKQDNQESELWVNPRDIPLSGMLKTIAPTQIGKMTAELTSFTKK